jgi:hypothetical protein
MRLYRGDCERTHVRLLAHGQLAHRRKALAAQPRAGAGRHEQRQIVAKQPQGGQVEVIVM